MLATYNLEKLKAATKPEFILAACLAGTVIKGSLTIEQDTLRKLMVQFDIPDGRNMPKRPMRGLGDAVARVAKPIARAVDRLGMTKLASCGGCKKRQEKLNKLVPFGVHQTSLSNEQI